jgi:hypothetical protein
MTKPLVQLIDVTTGEEILREMTDEEYSFWSEQKEKIDAEYEEAAIIKAQEEAAAKAKKTAKAQALAALGLSQEIVNLLAE